MWIAGITYRGSTYAWLVECSADLDEDGDGTKDPIQFCFLIGADNLGRADQPVDSDRGAAIAGLHDHRAESWFVFENAGV